MTNGKNDLIYFSGVKNVQDELKDAKIYPRVKSIFDQSDQKWMIINYICFYN